MKTIIAIIVLTASITLAQNQTCIIPSPAIPPRAKTVIVTVPGDGGTTGCTFHAVAMGATGAPGEYTMGNAKCATVVAMGDQAIANDNGWNDGGSP